MTEPDRDGQIVVPRGMGYLLDDWAWPDAARWDPDRAMGIDSERSTPSSPDFAQFRVTIDTRAYEAAMASVCESISRMLESMSRATVSRLGGDVTMELFDEALPSSPPTDVRERALWLNQHRNTGPDRDRWRIDRRRRS